MTYDPNKPAERTRPGRRSSLLWIVLALLALILAYFMWGMPSTTQTPAVVTPAPATAPATPTAPPATTTMPPATTTAPATTPPATSN